MKPYLQSNSSLKPLRQSLRFSQTDAERFLWSHLRGSQIHGLRFLRQYSVGTYILDFYCPSIQLAIELDGGQHNDISGMEADQKRTAFLEEKGIRVLRFWNNDVFTNIHGVLEKIQYEITPPNLPL